MRGAITVLPHADGAVAVAQAGSRGAGVAGGLIGEVDEIVDLIYETYLRYHRFLTRTTLTELRLPEWKSVFDVAWNPDLSLP